MRGSRRRCSCGDVRGGYGADDTVCAGASLARAVEIEVLVRQADQGLACAVTTSLSSNWAASIP